MKGESCAAGPRRAGDQRLARSAGEADRYNLPCHYLLGLVATPPADCNRRGGLLRCKEQCVYLGEKSSDWDAEPKWFSDTKPAKNTKVQKTTKNGRFANEVMDFPSR